MSFPAFSGLFAILIAAAAAAPDDIPTYNTSSSIKINIIRTSFTLLLSIKHTKMERQFKCYKKKMITYLPANLLLMQEV